MKDHKKRVARDLFSYAKKFQHCLLKRDLTEVRDLRDSLRPNVMKALSALSKFRGIQTLFDGHVLKDPQGLMKEVTTSTIRSLKQC